MLFQIVLLFFCYLSSINAQVLSYSRQDIYLMDICVNTTSDSFIYRCSDYGVYKYTYADSEECTGPVSITASEGCDESTNYYYDVDGCSEAQGGNTSSCKYLITGGVAYPLDRCYNAASGGSASYKYSCDVNGDVTYYTYSERDCVGTTTTNFYNHTLYDINCGTKDCGVTLTRYTSSINCNYEKSSLQIETRENSCNYFEASNGNPYPIGTCLASQQGYAVTSRKYKCVNDGSEVQLWSYLGNANCEGSGYLAGTYTASNNYTFYCGGHTCEHKYRQYSSCTNKYEYDDIPIIWNQCMKYYNQTANDQPSYNDMIYFMNSCKSGYKVVYYFTDPDCKYSNVYAVTNTTEDGDCPIEITGCTSSSGSKIFTNIIMFIFGFIILSIMI